MSHYIYLHGPVDKEHLEFMQKNSDEVFTAVEERRLTTDIYRKTNLYDINQSLDRTKINPAISLDISIFNAYRDFFENEKLN